MVKEITDRVDTNYKFLKTLSSKIFNKMENKIMLKQQLNQNMKKGEIYTCIHFISIYMKPTQLLVVYLELGRALVKIRHYRMMQELSNNR